MPIDGLKALREATASRNVRAARRGCELSGAGAAGRSFLHFCDSPTTFFFCASPHEKDLASLSACCGEMRRI
eukprot:scaffold32981_cov66-Phaeocystis_antarctica.AAC.3